MPLAPRSLCLTLLLLAGSPALAQRATPPAATVPSGVLHVAAIPGAPTARVIVDAGAPILIGTQGVALAVRTGTREVAIAVPGRDTIRAQVEVNARAVTEWQPVTQRISSPRMNMYPKGCHYPKCGATIPKKMPPLGGVTATVTLKNNTEFGMYAGLTFYVNQFNESTTQIIGGTLDADFFTAPGASTVMYGDNSQVGESPYMLASMTVNTPGGPAWVMAAGYSRSDACPSNNYVATITAGAPVVVYRYSGPVLDSGSAPMTVCDIIGCPQGGSSTNGIPTKPGNYSDSVPGPVLTWSCG